MKKLPQTKVYGLHPLTGFCYGNRKELNLQNNESIENGIIRINCNTDGNFNILILGGSTSDIYYNGSWVRPFSKILPNKVKNIYSIACPGYSTSQELLRMIECIKFVKPKICISLNGVNDFGMIQSYKQVYPYMHGYQARLFNYLLKQGSNAPNHGSYDKDEFKFIKRTINSVPNFQEKDDGFSTWRSNIEYMNFIAQNNNSRFFSILQPVLGISNGYKMSEIENLKYSELIKEKTSYEENMKSFYLKAKEYSEKTNFCYNFTAVLHDLKNVFEDTRHLNNFGNSILAMKIYSLISKELNK